MQYAISLDLALMVYLLCNYYHLACVLYLSGIANDSITQRQNSLQNYDT